MRRALVIILTLLAGCDDDGAAAPATLGLTVQGAFDVDEVRVWVKTDADGGRIVQRPQGEPFVFDLKPGRDLGAEPLTLQLQLRAGAEPPGGDDPPQQGGRCPGGERQECYGERAPACQGNWRCLEGGCDFECRGAFDGSCHPADCGAGENCLQIEGWAQCIDCARIEHDCGYWSVDVEMEARRICAYAGGCVCLPDSPGCVPRI